MKKKIFRGCLLVFILVLVGATLFYGPVIRDLWNSGILKNQLSAQQMREYQGSSMENLKALQTALMLYHESEEAFPDSSGWMDAISNRIKAGDMTQAEASKKFVNPLVSKGEGVFGYAMNDACSKRFKGDIKDPAKMPLLFDSSDTSWNAHGKPETLLPKPARVGGNMGISVTGEIIHFK